MVLAQCILLQESSSQLFAAIDILLTLEQFRQAIPDTLASYVSYGTRIVFETITISISHILSACQRPLSLLKWDSSNKTLSQISSEVSTYQSIWCMSH